jgi:hypothetical protein
VDIIAVAFFVSVALVIFRGNLGIDSSGYPQGTNALNFYTLASFRSHFPLSSWLFPYTDWGQPLPGYPGIDLLTGVALVNPFGLTALVRMIEFASFAGAGFALYWVLRKVSCTFPASVTAGFFYTMMAQTSQFFDGHVQAMVSIALAPFLFYFTFTFFRQPTALRGIALALTSFLLLTSGDLGVTYIFGFFAIPMALIVIATRSLHARYRGRELLTIAWTGGILLVGLLPWIGGYLGGLNPQYTTSITSTHVGFESTAGQTLWPSFVGFVADNSFTRFFLNSNNYALDFGRTGAYFLLIPCMAGAYVLLSNRRLLQLFYASGILAVFISTGPVYSSLSVVNRFLYDSVPLFDFNPTLFRWVEYSLLVEAIILGFALTAVERHFRAWLHSSAPATASATASPTAHTTRDRNPMPHAPRRLLVVRLARISAVVIVIVALVGSAGLAAVQNWESFSEPPGIFDFPENYTAGFQFVSDSPATGGILTIPFGNDGERTPWGGVSSSSELVGGIGSGHDTEIFEAGTPSSLSIDQFIGNGTTHGLTNNISKVLSALNVQYVVTTDYPNWSYASDPIYDPIASYVGFGQQIGFGSPVFHGGYQSVFAVPSPAGNISIFSTYVVYFGGDSVLYELLNQPWFNGSVALIDGSQVSFAVLQELAVHATALVSSPEGLANIPPSTLELAETSGVPVVVLAGDSDTSPGSAISTRNPWNVSNGAEFSTASFDSPVLIDSAVSVLAVAGYRELVPTVRAECPPSAVVTLSSNGYHTSNSTPPATDVLPFPYWNASIVSAGINNGGKYAYNGSVTFVDQNGTRLLNWSFAGHNFTDQYLNFRIHSLAGISGLQFNATTLPSGPLPFLMQILLNGTYADVKSYVSNIDLGTGQTTYSLYFPMATGPGAKDLLSNPGNITRFVIGLTSTGAFDTLELSNLTSFVTPARVSFSELALAGVPLGTGYPLTLEANTACTFDTVSLIAGESTESTRSFGVQSDYAARSSPMALSIIPTSSGWGILQVAQTYSAPWILDGSTSSSLHFPVNIGLNGWLVNFTAGRAVSAETRSASDVDGAMLVQVSAIPLLVVVGWGIVYRRRPSGN